jgi:hypothetical protein
MVKMKQPPLHIRHAIGSRVLLDSVRDNIHYAVEPYLGEWRFILKGSWPEQVKQILQFKKELNIFITEKNEDGSIQKWWYYDKKEPRMEFNEVDKILTILVDSKQGYTV